jgi:CelD/BcsL family acetyltransferase involved in cellulose biosynthesis
MSMSLPSIVKELEGSLPRVSSPSLNCQVETSFSEGGDLQPAWDEAVLRLGGPIYMTYDWLKTWWEFYGASKHLRLLIFWRGSQVVALLPLYLEDFGFGPFRTRVARIVGANIPPKVFNPPVDPAFASEVFTRTLRQLLDVDRCDLFSFGPVSQSWPCNLALKELSGSLSDMVGDVSHEASGVQTVFRLPATFEAYMASLSGNERAKLRKRLRALEKVGAITADSISAPAVLGEAFEAFARHHAEQWKSMGKGGHFTAWPKGMAFNRRLVESQGARGRVRFFRLLADGEVIGNRYAYVFGNTIFAELTSRAVGPRWDKLGLGGTAYMKFFEAALADGFSIIDSGLGAYDHKSEIGGQSVPVEVWRVTARRSRLKTGALLLIASAVKLIFDKVWYRRILPRLPESFGRSQFLCSLRFDF